MFAVFRCALEKKLDSTNTDVRKKPTHHFVEFSLDYLEVILKGQISPDIMCCVYFHILIHLRKKGYIICKCV